MCVSKMPDFYQNMGDSYPNLITWVEIYMSVLHFLSYIPCSREHLLMLFHQLL